MSQVDQRRELRLRLLFISGELAIGVGGLRPEFEEFL
jgi:hypothetical protein